MEEEFKYLEYIKSASTEERVKLCSIYYQIHPRCQTQGLRLFESLKTNYFCIVESYNKIQNNFNKVIEDYIEAEKKGYTSTVPYNKLLCMVRHFFSDVYSFLNIYATIYSSLLSPKGKPTPSRSFNDQRKMVLQNSNINEFVSYSEVLRDLTWYEKFHILRSEETHFLLGTIFVDKKEDKYFITYFSRTDSPRPERDALIEIDDVLLFIADILTGVKKLFDYISAEILGSIDPNKRCHIPFGVKNGQFCVKGLSIIEFILNKPGECITWQMPCDKFGKTCFAERKQ
ncbi:MAG TPA: hypothetical protein VMW67_03370 [Desulfobacteria bacterium]|nr:hypothetical protein [Desulfobacteria bacterium]